MVCHFSKNQLLAKVDAFKISYISNIKYYIYYG